MEERPRVAVRTGRTSSKGYTRSQPLRKGTRSDSEVTSLYPITLKTQGEPNLNLFQVLLSPPLPQIPRLSFAISQEIHFWVI